MKTIKGVILSRTEMTGSRFCSSIAVLGANRYLAQARLMNAHGGHLNSEGLSFGRKKMDRLWARGRLIEAEVVDGCRPRATHPEDLWVRPHTILLGEELGETDMRTVEDEFTCRTLHDLFPGIQIDSRTHKAHVPAGRIARSIGYVTCRFVHTLSRPDAIVTDSAGVKIVVAVKGTRLVRKIVADKRPTVYKNVTARLALAGQFGGERWDTERCYVMLSDVIE